MLEWVVLSFFVSLWLYLWMIGIELIEDPDLSPKSVEIGQKLKNGHLPFLWIPSF